MGIKCTRLVDNSGNQLNIRPHGNDIVTVVESGNIVEIRHTTARSGGGTIRRLSKDEYFDIRDGIVKQIEHHDKRVDDTQSIKRSMKQARDLINANCVIPKNCAWITLTYADNMQDSKKLYNDFKNFLKRLCLVYHYDRYIIAVEPQGRGAWHIHMIAIFTEKAPFIPNDKLRELWGHGFVSVKALDNIDNVGAYLTSYLSDIPVDEYDGQTVGEIKEVETFDENGNKVTKKYIKGARLKMYPSGMHIFRWSRNCTKPKETKITAQKADTLIEGLQPTYETTKVIESTETEFRAIINIRAYNRVRSNKCNSLNTSQSGLNSKSPNYASPHMMHTATT